MPRPSMETARGWREKTMVDRGGAPLGRIVHIYLDRVTEEPSWALVTAGQGSRQVFVPLVDAAEQEHQIRVPVERALVSDAPVIRAGRQLSKEDTGCMATTAAPRSCAGRAPGAHQAAGRPPGCCWPPGRLPRRWSAACCWPGAAEDGSQPGWPPPSAGPSGWSSRCPPGRCASVAAGGGSVPWSGRRSRPWPRQGAPRPGPGVASRSRPGRCNREKRGTGGHAWQAS
jgi:hypothetical protein